MTPPVFALLAVLPLAGMLAVRYRRLRLEIDRRARRTMLFRSALFVVLTGTGSGLLKAAGGSLPMPLDWTLLVIGAGSVWLSRGVRAE